MRTYVAGRTGDVERIRLLQAGVIGAGGSITFDWTDVEGPNAQGEIRKQWGGDPDAEARAAILSSREVDSCRECERLILLLCDTVGGLGCFVELGAALAWGREVWVVGVADYPRDSVFFYGPTVRRFATCVDALDALQAEAVAA